MKIFIVSIAHEDSYEVDPEEPRAFASRAGVSEYLTRRKFEASDKTEGHWVHEDSEGFETNANVILVDVKCA